MPKVAKKETKVTKRGKNEEVKKRKRKAKKDPNAPKNPMSAYLLFCEEWREKVKAQNPDSSFGELGRLLGEQWRAYTDDQKAPYIAKHEKAKAKYATEKAAYDAKKAQEDEDEDEDESD
ncbi:high mobility group box domain-containing protein [Gamsiella multidivaricata]|uniref:high mobility group box domain-containing protein n=1 Tax=Gamsiella multidivaricata TaxID=101098 RepID=UPI002220554F|nr:high mobility group box domain-containing protein [Gamsiella multidivaricata]KAG0365898.1 Non-histone chromosomal protein 6 [Gamsiella multidivaricata]KAI7822641.1 high mobility group box domain-containing protein [Gamsiella multidivaricata]